MARPPWLKLGKKTQPEPSLRAPIRLGNYSLGLPGNGGAAKHAANF